MAFVTAVVKRLDQLTFDPGRFHRILGKNNGKPIAARQCSANFIVPLLGANDVGLAEPNRYAMAA